MDSYTTGNYSVTSSARPSNDGGTASLKALAIFRLIISSRLAGIVADNIAYELTEIEHLAAFRDVCTTLRRKDAGGCAPGLAGIPRRQFDEL